jgi:hypothetical protein
MNYTNNYILWKVSKEVYEAHKNNVSGEQLAVLMKKFDAALNPDWTGRLSTRTGNALKGAGLTSKDEVREAVRFYRALDQRVGKKMLEEVENWLKEEE